MTQYYTIDGSCGSGKSYALYHELAENKQNGKLNILVTPIIELGNQAYNEIMSINPNAKVFNYNSKTVNNGVLEKITQEIKRSKKTDDTTIIITQESFLKLSCKKNKKHWNVIFDERLQLSGEEKINLSRHTKLFERLKFRDDQSNYFEIINKNDEELKMMAENGSRDSVYKFLSPTISKIVSPKYDVYLTRLSVNNYIKNKGGNLTFEWILNKNFCQGWKSVSFCAANISQSDFYIHLNAHHKITPHPFIVPSRPDFLKEKSKLLTLCVVSEQPNTKYIQRKEATFTNDTIKLVREHIGDPDAQILGIFNKNVSIKDKNIIRCSTAVQGLNSYMDTVYVMLGAATNYSPEHMAFRNYLGFDASRDFATHNQYQQICRTNIRDANSNLPVTAFISGLEDAMTLVDTYFPHAKIVNISDKYKLKNQASIPAISSVERTRKTREKKKQIIDLINQFIEKAKTISSLPPNFIPNINDVKTEFTPNAVKETTIYVDNSNALAIQTSKHISEEIGKVLKKTKPKSKKSKEITEITEEDIVSVMPTMAFVSNIHSTSIVHEVFNDLEDVLSLFKELHKKEYKSKNSNMLMSGAKFTKENDETTRGIANISSMSFITFDFDNTRLTPEDIFEVLKVKFLAYNTYSNSKYKKCWRLLIPLLCPIPIEIYEYLWTAIKHRLEHMFPHKHLGIDESKKTPNSLFYVPCQAADKNYSFFYEDGWNYNVLNPQHWVDAFDYTEEVSRKVISNKRSEAMEKLVNAILKIDQGKTFNLEHNIENARNILRAASSGNGDRAFFLYALRLKKFGIPLYQIESMLHNDASLTRTPKERKSQIKSIMRSLATDTYDRLV
jgi:hypothetical protein